MLSLLTFQIPTSNIQLYVLHLLCKKYDVDSHGNSVSFSVTTRLGGGLVKIDTKSHDHSMSFIWFYLFSMHEHEMDFGQVQFMAFPWHLLGK